MFQRCGWFSKLSWWYKSTVPLEGAAMYCSRKTSQISQRLSPTSSRISSVINTIPQSTPSPIQNWYHKYIYIYMHINMIIYDSICIQNCPRLIQICTLSYFFIIFDYWAYLASLIPFPVHEEQPPEIMAPVGDRNTGMGDRIDHSILAT